MLPPTLSPKPLLARTSRPNAQFVSFAHEYFPSLVHAIRINHHEARAVWTELRAQFETSGYWPLMVTYLANRSEIEWDELVLSEANDLFGRFYFDEEVRRKELGVPSAEPEAILSAAAISDPERAIAVFQNRLSGDPVEEASSICDALQADYGKSPDPDDLLRKLKTGPKGSWSALQRIAYDWFEAEGLELIKGPDPYWYEPVETVAMLLLPIKDPADILAYIHWFGSHAIGSPSTIALLRHWRESHGAELFCHYGTVLQLNLQSPIPDSRTAFNVASQLETICMQTPFMESASSIIAARHWHLHNRP